MVPREACGGLQADQVVDRDPHTGAVASVGAVRAYLIDGDGLLYRAANALPYKTNAAGLPVNGIRGFVSMLRELLRSGSPTHAAVAFTADPPLRKHTLDPRYKINHYEHPEEIKQQIPYAMRWAAALGVQPFLEPGLEADDIIATLLHRFAGVQTRIVTNDRDFYQLVSDHVRVLSPVRGTREMREVGIAEVHQAFGVLPAQVPDFKALVGDPTDDIPGVPGIGPKTAASLLRTHAKMYTERSKKRPEYHEIHGLLMRIQGRKQTIRRRRSLSRRWTGR